MSNIIEKPRIIYADPPYRYRNKGNGAAENHYQTMSTQQIVSLNVGNLAASSAALFLWTTWPMIQDGLAIMNAWGFEYKTLAFLWVKPKRMSIGWEWGTGFWTRANSEPCLLGVRGRIKPVSHSIHQIVEAHRGRHSEKPAIVREKIVELMGDTPRVELFARTHTPGWLEWGNEAPATPESRLIESLLRE